MDYYVASYEGDWVAHHGVKGQKWGVRRFQNPDGTLTDKGRARIKKLQNKEARYNAKADKISAKANKRRYKVRRKAEKAKTEWQNLENADTDRLLKEFYKVPKKERDENDELNIKMLKDFKKHPEEWRNFDLGELKEFARIENDPKNREARNRQQMAKWH